MAKITEELVLKKIQNGESLEGEDLSFISLPGADLRRSDFTNAILKGADLRGADLAGTVLDGADFSDANLAGVDLKGASLKKCTLKNASLENAKMMGANLKDANLEKANLHAANLVYANLTRAVLTGVDLTDVNLMGANMENSDLQGAKFGGTKLIYANLKGANMEKSTLQGAILVGADLRGVRLIGADLKGVKLWGAKLTGAKLMYANLMGANLVGADLVEANMSTSTLLETNFLKANLEIANLQGVNLDKANLVGANLKGAILREASLNHTDLSQADLRGADLRFAQLSNANLSEANISGAKVYGAVRWNVKCENLIADNLDFSQEEDAPQLHALSKEELQDFFAKVNPYMRLAIDGEVDNKALKEIGFYLDEIEKCYKDISLKLKLVESEPGLSYLEFTAHEEGYLFFAVLLILECIRLCCEKDRALFHEEFLRIESRRWSENRDLTKITFWSLLPLLNKFNFCSGPPQERGDFLNFVRVERIEINSSNAKRFTIVFSPNGKLQPSLISSDIKIQMMDFIKHVLTISDTGDLENQILPFDEFYKDYFSKEESFSFITRKTLDIARELGKGNSDFIAVIPILDSLQKKSVFAKAVLAGLKSIVGEW